MFSVIDLALLASLLGGPVNGSLPLASGDGVVLQKAAPATGETAPAAAAPAEAPRAIQDNSFLIEEAYNQEAGVVQHISTFQRNVRTSDWQYTFTQEWPVPRISHQFSVTVPVQSLEASRDGRAGVGDLAVNYRYQLTGDGDSRLAVAPRVSVLVPTGNDQQSRGAGGVGYQANLAASVVVNRRFVTHLNAGATVIPSAKNARGESASTLGFNAGQSFIWLARPTLNALVEVVYSTGQTVVSRGSVERFHTLVINPGVRFAINLKSGLQVVPGFSVPIGIGPSAGQRGVFFYLSFEHPMFHAR